MKKCGSTAAVAAMCAMCAAGLYAGTPVSITNAGFEKTGKDGYPPVGWSRPPPSNWHDLTLPERNGTAVDADFGPVHKIEGSGIDVSFGPMDYVMLRIGRSHQATPVHPR